GLAVAEAAVRERDGGCQRNVARELLPEITKLVVRVKDVVAGGVDRVLLRRGIVTGAARQHGAADVRLALKKTDRRIEISAGQVKPRRWRDLLVGGRARQSPVWNIEGLRRARER